MRRSVRFVRQDPSIDSHHHERTGDRKYFLPSCLFEDENGATVETPDIIFKFRS
jgi:hypothetical protein